MARTIKVAALQTAYGEDLAANIARTADLIREAAARGAQAILPSELFQGPYFCVAQEERWFATAHPWREHPCVTELAPLAPTRRGASDLHLRREGPPTSHLVMATPMGQRSSSTKSTSTTGRGNGKYTFAPGDTGFRVWTPVRPTRRRLCWNQVPEAARAWPDAPSAVLPPRIGRSALRTSTTPLPWRRDSGHAVSTSSRGAPTHRLRAGTAIRTASAFYGSILSPTTEAISLGPGRDGKRDVA